MGHLLMGAGAGLLSACFLWLRYGKRAGRKASRRGLADEPVSVSQRKLDFIRDVCDGNARKAEALLSEKMALDSSLSYEQAVEHLYADMLELTSDERAAILQHRERRSRKR